MAKGIVKGTYIWNGLSYGPSLDDKTPIEIPDGLARFLGIQTEEVKPEPKKEIKKDK